MREGFREPAREPNLLSALARCRAYPAGRDNVRPESTPWIKR